VVTEDGGRLGGTRSRRSLRLGAVLLAVSAAGAVAVVGTVGLAHGEELGDEALSWEAALGNVEPAEAYDPIPESLRDFPWTWQERASQAAHQIRATYPDDFSWFTFVPEGPGARIGFAGDVPDGAAEIVDSLRSHGERVEVFDDQMLTEHELLAANLYLTAAAQDQSATETTVQMHLGAAPVISVAGATSQADAVAALTQHLAVVAQTTGAPALEELPIEFAAPVNHEPTDPAYDGMVLGPQPYGRAGGNTTRE
jgi:hypothetical protein